MAEKKKQVRKNTKLTDAEWELFLRENGGLYARTARAIQKLKGVKMTRQEVKAWSDKHPDILQDIRDEVLDIAEEGLQGLIRSSTPNVKLRAIELYLKTQGKGRGYVERNETEFVGNKKIKLVVK